jgi:hypothetical protein
MSKNTSIPLDDEEQEVASVQPEQQATYKWDFKPRQQKKWGEITKRGLIVGRAPNQKVVPPDEVFYLASLGATNREIADWFGVHENTISYNFKDYIAKAKEETKQKLRQAQIKLALTGNAVMLIWLGKNMLGQSDQPHNTDVDKILPWSDDI